MLTPRLAVGMGAVLRRDLRIFTSYRTRLISQILSTVFTLALFYYVSRLVKVGAFASSDQYYAFVVIGLVILQVLQSTVSMSVTVRSELVAGTFERIVISPLGPVAGIVSMTLFPFLYSMFLGVVTLLIAGFVFGLPITWGTAALAIPIALLGSLAFAPVGLLVAAMVLAVKQAGAASAWLIALISLIAGFYFPVSLLPHWIRWASDVQPFTPAVDLLRHLLIGTPLRESAAVELAKLAGFAAVLIPLSLAALAAAVQFGRRRGTIIEY